MRRIIAFCPAELSLLIIIALTNWSATVSRHGECDIEPERAGKTSGPSKWADRPSDRGSPSGYTYDRIELDEYQVHLIVRHQRRRPMQEHTEFSCIEFQ